MRKSLTLTCAAMLLAAPSFAFAQTSGAGNAGVGNENSSAATTNNVHSGPNAPAAERRPAPMYEGRSSAVDPTLEMQNRNKVGNMPSSSESISGNSAGAAHDSE